MFFMVKLKKMKNFLSEIIETKKSEVERIKVLYKNAIFSEIDKLGNVSENEFKNRLKKQSAINCIGEIKKSSPSKGLLKKNFDPVKIAGCYHSLDLAAISILTDEKYFQGNIKYIRQVKTVTSIPILRKDFIIDPIQIYETKVSGADAFLLIVKLLSSKQLDEFIGLAEKLSLHCLTEVHTKEEIKKAVNAGAQIIGINNRDLETFKTDINISLELIDCIPSSCIKVSESALKSADVISRIADAGFDTVLIGEQFMRSENIKKTYQELFFKK